MSADDVAAALRSATVLAFPQRADDHSDIGKSTSNGDTDGGGAAGGADGLPPQPLRPLTDLGNAERFAHRNRDCLVFCPALGWLAWDGRRWLRDGADEAVARAAQDTARSIQDEAETIKTTPGVDFQMKGGWYSDRVAAWGRTSEAGHRLAAMPKLAAARMSVGVETFDRDPWRINVNNGTLVVDKSIAGYVVLHRHKATDYITRLAPVDYEPHAEAPLFDAFLDDVQPPSEDGTRAAQLFLKTWFGYALTGDTGEQRMVFLYGKGRNGKGVLISVVAWVSGDYADQIPIESFLDSGRARAGGQATPDIAMLPGVRMLGTSEPKKGAVLDEAFVKLFTGGDTIKARHLNRDFFSFRPQAKLCMQGNYRPRISGGDEGIWARILLVPFPVFIPAERRDAKLLEKLKAEGSGILNRLLDGLRYYLEHGLVLPTAVVDATERYRDDSDPLARFLSECVAQKLGARVSATAMHALFVEWAKASGEAEWSIKGLGAALKERGMASKRSNGSWWLDVALIRSASDFVDGMTGCL